MIPVEDSLSMNESSTDVIRLLNSIYKNKNIKDMTETYVGIGY